MAKDEKPTAGPLPNFAQQLAAQPLPARLTSRHHAFGSGEDVDSKSAQHPWNLSPSDVDPAAWTRHARQVRDYRLIVIAILQVDAQDFVALFFCRLEIGDETFFFQNTRNFGLQLGSRNIHFLMPR